MGKNWICGTPASGSTFWGVFIVKKIPRGIVDWSFRPLHLHPPPCPKTRNFNFQQDEQCSSQYRITKYGERPLACRAVRAGGPGVACRNNPKIPSEILWKLHMLPPMERTCPHTSKQCFFLGCARPFPVGTFGANLVKCQRQFFPTFAPSKGPRGS